MAKVQAAKQILAVSENRVGMLADASAAISETGANIKAISAYAVENRAFFRILTSDNQKAKSALEAKGFEASEQDIVMLELPNRVGILKEAADKLKAAGINLTYIYGTTCAGSCDCLLIFASNDNAQAMQILKG